MVVMERGDGEVKIQHSESDGNESGAGLELHVFDEMIMENFG